MDVRVGLCGWTLSMTSYVQRLPTGHGGELVPVLHRHDERVRAAVEALFPRAYEREAAVSNAQGWAAGRSAADLAELGPRERLATTECKAS